MFSPAHNFFSSPRRNQQLFPAGCWHTNKKITTTSKQRHAPKKHIRKRHIFVAIAFKQAGGCSGAGHPKAVVKVAPSVARSSVSYLINVGSGIFSTQPHQLRMFLHQFIRLRHIVFDRGKGWWVARRNRISGNGNSLLVDLGWNAVHCCGDPMAYKVDNLDFIINGAMGIFLDSLHGGGTKNDNSGGGHSIFKRRVPVIPVVAVIGREKPFSSIVACRRRSDGQISVRLQIVRRPFRAAFTPVANDVASRRKGSCGWFEEHLCLRHRHPAEDVHVGNRAFEMWADINGCGNTGWHGRRSPPPHC